MIKRLEAQLQSQDVDIELTEEAKEVLSSRGYDPTLGARPLRRAIQRLIEDPLSEKILWKEFEAGDMILVDTEENEDGEKELVFRKAERTKTPDHPPVELAGASLDSADIEASPEG